MGTSGKPIDIPNSYQWSTISNIGRKLNKLTKISVGESFEKFSSATPWQWLLFNRQPVLS